MPVAELQRANTETHVSGNRSIAERLSPWKSNSETLHSGSNETVVYQQGQSRTRKIIGETMVWGGGIYGIYNLLTLDLSGALLGGATHIVGRWVRPKTA